MFVCIILYAVGEVLLQQLGVIDINDLIQSLQDQPQEMSLYLSPTIVSSTLKLWWVYSGTFSPFCINMIQFNKVVLTVYNASIHQFFLESLHKLLLIPPKKHSTHTRHWVQLSHCARPLHLSFPSRLLQLCHPTFRLDTSYRQDLSL